MGSLRVFLHVHVCLAELPEKHRRVLILRHFDGLKFKEIAEELDITIGQAAGLARDGLKSLTDLFDPPN